MAGLRVSVADVCLCLSKKREKQTGKFERVLHIDIISPQRQHILLKSLIILFASEVISSGLFFSHFITLLRLGFYDHQVSMGFYAIFLRNEQYIYVNNFKKITTSTYTLVVIKWRTLSRVIACPIPRTIPLCTRRTPCYKKCVPSIKKNQVFQMLKEREVKIPFVASNRRKKSRYQFS